MRILAAVAAVQAVLFGADTAGGLPPWLYAAGSLVGSGVLVRYYLVRAEKRVQEAVARKTDVDTRQIEEQIQVSILARSKAAMAEMQAEVDKLHAQLADARTALANVEKDFARQVAERNRREGVMRGEIERLHDELAAMQHGKATGKRRRDPEDA